MKDMKGIDDEFIQALKFDYIFNNQFEELPDYLDRESEDRFKSLKKGLAHDVDFKNKYFPSSEEKIVNDFRFAKSRKYYLIYIQGQGKYL